MMSGVRCRKCGTPFDLEDGPSYTAGDTIRFRPREEGEPKRTILPEFRRDEHEFYCRWTMNDQGVPTPPKHPLARGPGQRFQDKPWGFLDVVSVRHSTFESPGPRSRDYLLRHVSSRDAPYDLKRGETLYKRVPLDSEFHGAQIFLGLHRRNRQARDGMRNLRKSRRGKSRRSRKSK